MSATQTINIKDFAATQSLEGGEGGIRTPGTGFPAHQISNLAHSATLPPLRAD